jgi:hypothetical protein
MGIAGIVSIELWPGEKLSRGTIRDGVPKIKTLAQGYIANKLLSLFSQPMVPWYRAGPSRRDPLRQWPRHSERQGQSTACSCKPMTGLINVLSLGDQQG